MTGNEHDLVVSATDFVALRTLTEKMSMYPTDEQSRQYDDDVRAILGHIPDGNYLLMIDPWA
jgi:hypothetical protein